MSWDFPAGVTGPEETELEMACRNPHCASEDKVQSLTAVKDLGTTYLCDEDEAYCRDCGYEMDVL